MVVAGMVYEFKICFSKQTYFLIEIRHNCLAEELMKSQRRDLLLSPIYLSNECHRVRIFLIINLGKHAFISSYFPRCQKSPPPSKNHTSNSVVRFVYYVVTILRALRLHLWMSSLKVNQRYDIVMKRFSLWDVIAILVQRILIL